MDRVALVVGYLTISGIAVTAGWCLLVEGARWLRGPEPRGPRRHPRLDGGVPVLSAWGPTVPDGMPRLREHSCAGGAR